MILEHGMCVRLQLAKIRNQANLLEQRAPVARVLTQFSKRDVVGAADPADDDAMVAEGARFHAGDRSPPSRGRGARPRQGLRRCDEASILLRHHGLANR